MLFDKLYQSVIMSEVIVLFCIQISQNLYNHELLVYYKDSTGTQKEFLPSIFKFNFSHFRLPEEGKLCAVKFILFLLDEI